jgi:ribosomal protein S18 acetylase RimI-like enzyme
MNIFVQAPHHPRVFVAHEAGQVLGIVVIEPQLGEIAYVTQLLVGDRRREGIATLLMQEAEEYYRKFGYKRMRLEVAQGNVAARRLYRKLGFRTSYRKPGYYWDAKNPTAIVMIRDLEERQ